MKVQNYDPHLTCQVLEISEDASSADIKVAYRRLAIKYHPDKCEQEDNGDAFKKVSNAYQVLSDPAKKAQSDREGDGTASSHCIQNVLFFAFQMR